MTWRNSRDLLANLCWAETVSNHTVLCRINNPILSFTSLRHAVRIGDITHIGLLAIYSCGPEVHNRVQLSYQHCKFYSCIL